MEDSYSQFTRKNKHFTKRLDLHSCRLFMGLENFREHAQRPASPAALQGARGGRTPGLSRRDNDAASENETVRWIDTPPLVYGGFEG
jgi:hypothetical protein